MKQIGEQTPAQGNHDAPVEYQTYLEHMKKDAAELNTGTLTRPSLKNEVLKDGAFYASKAV